jgi:DNA-binding transcriptional LysR family regulator
MSEVNRILESIDLQLLELFVTIARSKTIASAARQFNVSPSLATRRLAALERALQVRLFQRTTRALHLTDAGRDTLEWADLVLSSHAALMDELSHRDQMPEGLVRLAVSDYVASMLLPDFLTGFMKRYPKVNYLIKTTDHLVNPVDQAFDVAVHSGFMPDSSLIGIPVRPVQRILCASPAYLKQAGAIDSLNSSVSELELEASFHRDQAARLRLDLDANTSLLQPMRDHIASSGLQLVETPGLSEPNSIPVELTVTAAP